MGATTFVTRATGTTAQKAFNDAVRQALYDYGHRGYTGSIAEKDSFVLIATVPSLDDAYAKADQLIHASDERIDDKWGPAGCIQYGTDLYLFFGWASQ